MLCLWPLKYCCDYIINYYYIQSSVIQCVQIVRCDYIINYYYIQYDNEDNITGLVVITL